VQVSAALVIGVVIHLWFALLVLGGMSSSGSPGAAVEPTLGPRALVMAACFAAPAALAVLGAMGRPVLLASAAMVALALVAVPFSVLSFVLLLPGALFLRAAASPPSPRDGAGAGQTGWTSARLTVAATAALIVAGAVIVLGGFLVLWSGLWLMAFVAIVGAAALILRHAAGEPARGRALRTGAGGLLAAGLALAALVLPLVNTSTVCWQSTAGRTWLIDAARAAELGRPPDAGMWGFGSVGPDGSSDAAGCDGGVPTATSLVLSVGALAACVAAAVVVVPRAAVPSAD
jgi:hypothetical protein